MKLKVISEVSLRDLIDSANYLGVGDLDIVQILHIPEQGMFMLIYKDKE